METANTLRVSAYAGSYGGRGGSPQDRQQLRRLKIVALLEAVESGNLEAAKSAFKLLANFDRVLVADAQFVRLSQLLATGSVYLAQQLVREIKTKLINTLPLGAHSSQADASKRVHQPDGLHFVDTRA